MTNTRFACLLVSDFPLAVVLRRDPTLLLEPVALAASVRENAAILAANGKATRAGVRIGSSVAQAHTLCPGLRVLVREPQRETEQAEQLLELLQNVTPLVEPEVPGVFTLEASGTERLYGGELQLAEKLIASFKGQGYPVQVGIGGSKFVARVAAMVSGRQRHTCVPTDSTREFLEPLPLSHLELDQETEQRLLQLGLRTLGQLAAFPANELQARFGEIGLEVAQRSRGFDVDHFLPELLAEQLIAAEYFTTPLYRSTTVLTATRSLLEGLLEQLQAQGESCRSLALCLGFGGGEQKWLTFTVAQPTTNAATLLRQIQMQFEKQRFAEAVTEIKIIISESTPQQFSQLDLVKGNFNHINPDKLQSLSGSPALCSIQLNSASLPEKSFSLQPLTEKHKTRHGEIAPRVSPFPHEIGLRLFPNPENAEVVDCNGVPRQLLCAGRRLEIEQVNGPWKVSGNWWQRTFYRHYYEVETRTQQRYLLYFDSISERWFVQGVFD